MPSYTQANRPLEVTTALGKDVLLITGFRGDEGISRLFQFQIDMIAESKTDIAFDKVLGQKVTLRISMPDGKPRYFSGICNRFGQGESDGDMTTYHLEMVPTFWLWTQVARSRIFQQKSVPDILKAVLQGLDVTMQIQGTFEPRNYCVQYRETDFNFATRLMEEEGIFYFFTHTADGHKMVVANAPQSHVPVPAPAKLIFERNLSALWRDDRILAWEKQQELLTGQFLHWDHTFELPGRHLDAKRKIPESVQVGKTTHKLNAGGAEAREVYDHPGDYALRFDGINPGGGEQAADVQKIFSDNDRTVALRAQQEAVQGLSIRGSSTCRNLASGHKFTLDKHGHGDGDYLVTSVSHQTNSNINYSSGGSEEFQYMNSFTAIPLAMPFRPQRMTPKPFVQGTQTATVVGPKGQEICTDKYGRVKVQFHWDREGKLDDKSSCWVRVAQMAAGKRWGMSFWPRIGQEVVVAFLEGNPDSPIIVGSVYNAEQMPPYLGDGLDSKHPKDNKVYGVKTNTTPGGDGFNEWRFDDTDGKEQIFMHGERNMDLRIKNDRMEQILNDTHLTVGGNQNELVKGNKNMNVKGNQVEKIEGNQQLTVAGNVDGLVKGNAKETIKGTNSVHVSGDRNEKVDGGQSLTVGGDEQEKIGSNYALEAGQAIHLKAGATLVIEAASQLTLAVGGNFVVIDSSGVSIVGTLVKINSGGAAGSGSPSSPTAPQDAQEASPVKPTEADDSKSGKKSAPG